MHVKILRFCVSHIKSKRSKSYIIHSIMYSHSIMGSLWENKHCLYESKLRNPLFTTMKSSILSFRNLYNHIHIYTEMTIRILL